MRLAALAWAGIALFLVLGCGNGSNDGSDNKKSEYSDGISTKPTVEVVVPPPPPPPPAIDVVIRDFVMPSHIQRGQEFELTLVLVNTISGSPAIPSGSVEFRAQISDALGASDVPMGDATFQNLQPQIIHTRKVKVRAPHRTGLWTVTAKVKPLNFKDDTNNEMRKQLAVD